MQTRTQLKKLKNSHRVSSYSGNKITDSNDQVERGGLESLDDANDEESNSLNFSVDESDDDVSCV